ncbi:MAG: YgjV family protein [Gammaproteobacteria bacterium]|nr:YgjV family protein [Gammaproteobacteria bacterium]
MSWMTHLLEANLSGVLLYPLVYWQFAGTHTQRGFLLANLASCLVGAVAYGFLGAVAATEVSLLAGATSLAQAMIRRETTWVRWVLAGAGIAGCWMVKAPPVTFWGLFPFAVFVLNRIAESRDHLTMRLLFVLSPFSWILIAVWSRAWTLVPVEILGLYASLRWVRGRMSMSAQGPHLEALISEDSGERSANARCD